MYTGFGSEEYRSYTGELSNSERVQWGEFDDMSMGPCVIVDNRRDQQELIELVLQDLDFTTVAMGYSSQVFPEIELIKPRLLVIDLEYGRSECWALLGRVQNSKITKQVPVVCLSTMDEPLCHAKGLYDFCAGVRFVKKPFDVIELEKIVCSLLAERVAE